MVEAQQASLHSSRAQHAGTASPPSPEGPGASKSKAQSPPGKDPQRSSSERSQSRFSEPETVRLAARALEEHGGDPRQALFSLLALSMRMRA